MPRKKLTEKYRASRPQRPSGAWKASSVIEITGVAGTVDEHARAAQMPMRLLLERLNAGWTPELIAVLLKAYDPARPRSREIA